VESTCSLSTVNLAKSRFDCILVKNASSRDWGVLPVAAVSIPTDLFIKKIWRSRIDQSVLRSTSLKTESEFNFIPESSNRPSRTHFTLPGTCFTAIVAEGAGECGGDEKFERIVLKCCFSRKLYYTLEWYQYGMTLDLITWKGVLRVLHQRFCHKIQIDVQPSMKAQTHIYRRTDRPGHSCGADASGTTNPISVAIISQGHGHVRYLFQLHTEPEANLPDLHSGEE
jgi:hypothetical protein